MRRTNTTERPAIAAVLVAVPARDEEDHIAACLRRIDAAASHWGGRVITVVGVDSSSDATASVARRHVTHAMELAVVEGDWGRAGRTRHAITGLGLDLLGGDAGAVWIASTDADCEVGRAWISRQVREADRGADVILGVVQLDAATPASLRLRFSEVYTLGSRSHPHVHAANLGLRASSYRSAGGWNQQALVGEDHDLVRRAIARDLRVVRPSDHTVITSGRTRSRVHGGFATDLAQL